MKTLENNEKISSYAEHFSEEKFAKKITKIAKKAGSKVVYAAFLLYYSLFDPEFPAKQRVLIIGALGYLILPLDLLPDALPFVGLTDDFVALAYAVKTVFEHITPEVKEKARHRVASLFGELREEEIKIF